LIVAFFAQILAKELMFVTGRDGVKDHLTIFKPFDETFAVLRALSKTNV